MYCHKCGKEVGDVKFCPNCGAQLKDLDETITSDTQQTTTTGPTVSSGPVVKDEDAPSMGYLILSIFIPVVGLVLFIIWNKEYPKRAKSCLNGFIASIIISLVLSCCMISSFQNQYNQYSGNGYSEDIDFDFDW